MIKELIKREAPNDDEHDRNYKRALEAVYDSYNHCSVPELKEYLELARKYYRIEGTTHYNTAACVVIKELIKWKTSS